MMRLNNRGQSLVMFIIIIPIILIMFVFVYDVGTAIYEKNRVSNINYMTIDYGLNNIDSITENDLINYIRKNLSDVNNISVTIKDNSIDITIDKKIKNIFNNLYKYSFSNISSQYHGEIEGDKKKIERVK